MNETRFQDNHSQCCDTDENGFPVPATHGFQSRDENGNLGDAVMPNSMGNNAMGNNAMNPSTADSMGSMPDGSMNDPSNSMASIVPTEPSTTPPREPGTAIYVPPEEGGQFDNEAYQGSMQQILGDNLGQFVVVEFLIGTNNMTTKEGILYAVGRSYVTLFDERNQTYVVCDIFSVKFVTFFQPGRRPRGYPTNTGSRNLR